MNWRGLSVLVGIFVVSTSALRGAEDVVPGLYSIAPTDSANMKATAPDGSVIGLSSLVTKTMGDVLIRSKANDNSRFMVLVFDAGPLGARRNVALAAGQWAVPLHDGNENQTTHKVSFSSTNLIDAKAAEQVAAALKIKTLPRIHPGHRARVTWRPIEASYKIGTAPVLELEIENVGEVPICFAEGGRQRGPRDNQFAFVAMRSYGHGKAVPDTGDPNHHGGLGGITTIEPGKTWTKRVTLDKWFQFTEADTYEITGTYRVQLYPTAPGNRLRAADYPVWDEFFTGECLLKMTKE